MDRARVVRESIMNELAGGYPPSAGNYWHGRACLQQPLSMKSSFPTATTFPAATTVIAATYFPTATPFRCNHRYRCNYLYHCTPLSH